MHPHHTNGYVFCVKPHRDGLHGDMAIQSLWMDLIRAREKLRLLLQDLDRVSVTALDAAVAVLRLAHDAYKRDIQPFMELIAQEEEEDEGRFLMGRFFLSVPEGTVPYIWVKDKAKINPYQERWMTNALTRLFVRPTDIETAHRSWSSLYSHLGGWCASGRGMIPCDLLELLCHVADVACEKLTFLNDMRQNYVYTCYSSREEEELIGLITEWLGPQSVHVMDGAFGCGPRPRFLVKRTQGCCMPSDSGCSAKTMVSRHAVRQWRRQHIPILVLKRKGRGREREAGSVQVDGRRSHTPLLVALTESLSRPDGRQELVNAVVYLRVEVEEMQSRGETVAHERCPSRNRGAERRLVTGVPERDTDGTQGGTAMAEMDATVSEIRSELAQVTAERDAAVSERDTAVSQRDAEGCRHTAVTERDAAVLAATQAECTRLRERVDEVERETEETRQTLRTTTIQHERECAAITDVCTAVEHNIDAAVKSRDQAVRREDKALAEVACLRLNREQQAQAHLDAKARWDAERSSLLATHRVLRRQTGAAQRDRDTAIQGAEASKRLAAANESDFRDAHSQLVKERHLRKEWEAEAKEYQAQAKGHKEEAEEWNRRNLLEPGTDQATQTDMV
ncbi:hypothetical protein KIPB_007611 [Kipferlia bialata]|uniref:Uncharacterized protein n=1 Tax=Kipferlia bialata TaxID=797122 RepID=A0A391NQE4_9EUKA|nr:hypothetical protein KIPB_007611 [Kipferlia bialata]|eukprot:g7611.t1